MAVSIRQLYAITDSGLQLAEVAPAWQRTVPEKLVRCLWFDQRWRPQVLQTLSGQRITVHHPGRWNVQAGPDFQQAVLEFDDDGVRQRGDVEIHRYASGWTAHRHHTDPRYNRVILHVFLWKDRQAAEVYRADGYAIPQLALAPCLPMALAAYQADITLDDYPYQHAPMPGRCYEALRRLDPGEVQAFLSRAGEVRLQQRMSRWAQRAAAVGLQQVLYEAVMRALGATGYRQHFQRLARLVTWQELQDCLQTVPIADREQVAEALLFGLAGMLHHGMNSGDTIDHETQSYRQALQRYWATFPEVIRARAWCNVVWRQPHVRPANTPERRLAAMAQLLAVYHATSVLDVALTHCHSLAGQTDRMAVRRLHAALLGVFALPCTSYWSQRTHWGSHKRNPQRLIGAQRARIIVIDAVLPILLLAAQGDEAAPLRAALLACYQTAPRLPDNALLRYMRRRLLGNDPALLSVVTGSCQQQGMLQIFYDYCDNDEGDCQGCEFPLLSAL